jgi:hypothetical protein
MNTLQIHSSQFDNAELLKYAGVKRIHDGWYTVQYRGVTLDKSIICAAKRNKNGQLKWPPK